MGAVPARCLQCHRDLRYDLINLRFVCPACSSTPEKWRKRGEVVGRAAARLLRRVEGWFGKGALPERPL